MSVESWKVPLSQHFPDLYPKDVESILDAGCGISVRSQYLPARIRVAVDIFKPVVDHAQELCTNGTYFICCDLFEITKYFPRKYFDVVLFLDGPEHFSKSDGLKAIELCESMARKAVIIEVPQSTIMQNIDIQGFNNPYQEHKSGWEESELVNLGYCVVKRPYVMQDVKRHTDIDNQDPNITIMNAIKILS